MSAFEWSAIEKMLTLGVLLRSFDEAMHPLFGIVSLPVEQKMVKGQR